MRRLNRQQTGSSIQAFFGTIVLGCCIVLFLNACSNKQKDTEGGRGDSSSSALYEQGSGADQGDAQDAQDAENADSKEAKSDPRLESSSAKLSLDNGVELGVLDQSIQNSIGIRQAPEGQQYISLQLRLFNGGESRFSFIDRQFELRHEGSAFSAKPELFAPDPDFGGSGTLMPGLAREGWMVFRIPDALAGIEAKADAPSGALELGLAPELGEAPAAFLSLP